MSVQCCQCDRQAILAMEGPTLIGEVSLCLHCYNVFTMAEVAQSKAQAVWINHAVMQMHAKLPVGLQPPLIDTASFPEPPVNNTTNNIIGSQIGMLNTGTVLGQITATIGDLIMQENHATSDALSTLTQAIAGSISPSEAKKQEMLEQLNLLAENIKKPEAERQKSIIRMVATALAASLSVFADLATVWDTVGPTILSALRL